MGSGSPKLLYTTFVHWLENGCKMQKSQGPVCKIFCKSHLFFHFFSNILSNLLFHFPFYHYHIYLCSFLSCCSIQMLSKHCHCGATPVHAQSTTTVQVGLSGHAPKASEDWTEAFGLAGKAHLHRCIFLGDKSSCFWLIQGNHAGSTRTSIFTVCNYGGKLEADRIRLPDATILANIATSRASETIQCLWKGDCS